MRTGRPLLVFLLLLLAGCDEGYDPPDLRGVPVRFTVLHTADIHSRIFPYAMIPQFTDERLGLLEENGPFGGAARMATVIRRERARAGRSLHLDTGDIFQGAPVFNVYRGEVEIRALAELGIDAIVAGNHEFDAGARNYATQLEKWSNFRTLAANYDFASADDVWNNRLDALVDPWAIFDLDGLKVGVVGMGNLSSLTSIHDRDNSMDVYARDTMTTVLAATASLAAQVDIVIVVTHLSLDTDEAIARLDPNVDIVLGGHLHVALDPIKVVESEVVPGKRVVVSHAGAFAKYVQRLDFVVQDGDVLAWDNTLFPLDARLPADPDMLDLLAPYEQGLRDTIDLQRIVARTGDRLRRFGNDGGDSPLGNLVIEAMQFRPGIETDFGVTNSLGIRTDVQGPGLGEESHAITVEELFNVLPFDNTITTMFLSGAEVQQLFDFISERSAERGCNAQAQISSARFVMDCGAGVALDATIGGSWTPCESDEDCPVVGEICSSEACGRPVAGTEGYELATNNYIAAGGSGFWMLENNTTQEDTGISMRDAVEFYMLQLQAADGERTLNDWYPAGDGRIGVRF